jgi:hypothetical protein
MSQYTREIKRTRRQLDEQGWRVNQDVNGVSRWYNIFDDDDEKFLTYEDQELKLKTNLKKGQD